MSSSEIAEWRAYERVCGPIGDERMDILFAQLMAHMANLKRTKRQKAFRIQDFLIQWDGPKRQSVEEQMQMAKTITQMFGGTVH